MVLQNHVKSTQRFLYLLQEEDIPEFVPPEVEQIWKFTEPEYKPPAAPAASVEPIAPIFGDPAYGYDWSGEKPFQVRTIKMRYLHSCTTLIQECADTLPTLILSQGDIATISTSKSASSSQSGVGEACARPTFSSSSGGEVK